MQLQNPPNSCQTMPMLLSSDDLDEMLTRIHSSAAAGSLESQTLDFKQTPPNRMEAVKTLVEASICFANGHSGTVVVAVADATGGPGSFTGCDLDPATVQRRIYELTEPHLMAGVRAIERFGASHRSGTTCRFRSRWCSARRSSTARGIAFCRSDYGWGSALVRHRGGPSPRLARERQAAAVRR